MSTQFMNKVVALEGNIGAGKSTLCGKVKRMYPDKCSLYKEQGNEKFLKLFYSNPVLFLSLHANQQGKVWFCLSVGNA